MTLLRAISCYFGEHQYQLFWPTIAAYSKHANNCKRYNWEETCECAIWRIKRIFLFLLMCIGIGTEAVRFSPWTVCCFCFKIEWRMPFETILLRILVKTDFTKRRKNSTSFLGNSVWGHRELEAKPYTFTCFQFCFNCLTSTSSKLHPIKLDLISCEGRYDFTSFFGCTHGKIASKPMLIRHKFQLRINLDACMFWSNNWFID